VKKHILLILVDGRKNVIDKVQKILTGWGCMIKTRLGIHDGTLENCTDTGLIILELVGEDDKKKELTEKLSKLSGVSAKLVEISL
jgi:hypothetical protein